ncbi:ethanolamine ammonia-lyase reactivating factor EutA [Candidatus Saccharibacteria bacterium]|jgi:cell division protein FtsA|nr:ethanolamine ammonia-lyase reactivating factor EutA [Candidatus Saccharibacteria bacterium]
MAISLQSLNQTLKDKVPNVKSRVSSGRQQAGEYIVALDIGTEFVKALVARIVGNEIEVIGVGRAHQELADMQAGAIADIAAVVANCDHALAAAEQAAGVSARTAVIGIAGELVKGTTSTVRFTRQNPNRELDIEEMGRIIELVQERAETKARQELAWELGGKDVDVRLVNSALVRIDIDGYKVTNPIGFQGRDLVVEMYTAFAPMIHIGALERTAAELDLELLAVAAEPFAVARSVVGDDPNASVSAVLMDVGGGTTDIAVVNEGGVEGTKMFGIGGRAFTHSIERELDISYAKAESIKVGLSGGKVAATQKEKVEKALTKTLNVWSNGVELALAEFNKLDHLPQRVLLCGGGSSLDMLMEALENGDWYKDLPFTKKPTVQHIKPDEVIGITDKTGDITDHTFITAMGLLRVGMDTLNSGAAASDNSLRERLNKVLRV